MATIERTGDASYEGLGPRGKGLISTQSGVIENARYDFGARFANEPGTNPEELIAAAHAACFTMALSFALAAAGHKEGSLHTKAVVSLDKTANGFAIMESALTLDARIPGITPDDFARIVAGAKENCPVSKVLACDIALTSSLA